MTVTESGTGAQALVENVLTFLPDWHDGDLSLAQAQAWIDAGVGWDTVVDWLVLMVPDPGVRPAGLSPSDCLTLEMLTDVGLSAMWRTPTVETARWAGVADCCPRAVTALAGREGDPAAVVALARRLWPLSPSTGPYGRAGLHGTIRCASRPCPERDAAVRVAGEPGTLDLFGVAVCLSAGMGLDEAIGYVREGRDMDPVRVLAALA